MTESEAVGTRLRASRIVSAMEPTSEGLYLDSSQIALRI